MIKRTLVILVILIASISILLGDTYSSGDMPSASSFQLRLGKVGTNKIWFSSDAAGTNAIPNNRHVFPMMEAGTTSLDSTLYFHWSLDDYENSTVELIFSSSDSEFDGNRFMLKDNSMNGKDINFNVRVTPASSDSTVGALNNSADLQTALSQAARTILLTPTTKDQHFAVKMSVLPAFGGQYMRAQYSGYIVAILYSND